MKNVFLNQEQIANIIKIAKLENKVDAEACFKIFYASVQTVISLKKDKIIQEQQVINVYIILQYVLGELVYVYERNQEKLLAIDDLISIVNRVVDKYVSIELFSIKTHGEYSRYSPVVTNIMTMISFMLSSIPSLKDMMKNEIRVDILEKVLFLAKCTIDLLVAGFETEAFSTWRTLHESECILIVLSSASKKGMDSYLRHIIYNIAFRDGIKDKSEQDKIFIEIKEKMKKHDLKSKDMKKFIEYGWLYEATDTTKFENFKLNFRNGLEVAAHLGNYNKWYEMSSEIAHSSPLLIYSRKVYFAKVTILNLFESFFRIEKIFTSVYTNNLDQIKCKKYLDMRNEYMDDIHNIYEDEKKKFLELTRN